MSTNKTPNYHLHAWEPGDDFLRAEMNENFAAIDAMAARVMWGTYTGNGLSNEQVINLGIQPLAVLVFFHEGALYSSSSGSGLAVGSNAAGGTALVIVNNGFRVKNDQAFLNMGSGKYHYLVFY